MLDMTEPCPSYDQLWEMNTQMEDWIEALTEARDWWRDKAGEHKARVHELEGLNARLRAHLGDADKLGG